VTIEARDPTIATLVHDFCNYAPEDIRFGMRYADAVSVEEDGTPVADLTRIGALEPDLGEHWEGFQVDDQFEFRWLLHAVRHEPPATTLSLTWYMPGSQFFARKSMIHPTWSR
jgi:hypothetical protein